MLVHLCTDTVNASNACACCLLSANALIVSCLRVSQLNEMARNALSECFGPEVWVKGEIHGLKVHAKSGHMYFDLVEKPSGTSDAYIAKVSCAFFKGAFVKWQYSITSLGLGRFELNSGLEIKLKARVDLFVKEGRYQLIVSQIDPGYTFGAIAKKRAETIDHLKATGLMEKNKQLPLPALPLNIGLITSQDSAAYHDFMSIIAQSNYSFIITLFDAHMQGENTVPEVIRGIGTLQRHRMVDTIVIIRGGGAKTDLFSFDDPALCTAIAQCPKPVITGIGHEIDISVADMVAHTYCVTPTDVARFFISQAEDLWEYLNQARQVLSIASQQVRGAAYQRMESNAALLEHITRRWALSAYSRLKGLAYAIHTKVLQNLSARENQLNGITMNLKGHTGLFIEGERRITDLLEVRGKHITQTILDTGFRDIRSALSSLETASMQALSSNLHFLDQQEHVVRLMNPAETLKRGYSITLSSSGRRVTDPADVEEGERITTYVQKGTIMSTVYDKESSS